MEIVPQSADLDGVVAAPEHHRVLFENDRVRVIETSIPAGDITPVHTHLASAVQFVVAGSHFVRRDPSGQVGRGRWWRGRSSV